MGAGQSAISQCKNDFELVVRATKELEFLLETHFGAPSGKEHGLHDKITAARHDGRPLPDTLQRQMRKLVTIRNKLVHDRDFNAIPERSEFAASFDSVEKELKRMLPKSASSGCVIS